MGVLNQDEWECDVDNHVHRTSDQKMKLCYLYKFVACPSGVHACMELGNLNLSSSNGILLEFFIAKLIIIKAGPRPTRWW